MKPYFRIAFVDYVLDPTRPGRSGLSDIVWDMASHLVNLGHEVHVVASYHSYDVPDNRVHVHNFPTPPIGYRNIVGQVWILKRAATIIRQLAPDIVHAPEYISTAVMATLHVPAPLVLTVPGNIYYRLSVKDGTSYQWHFVQVLKWAATVSAKKCSSIIAISDDMKFWWERTGSPANRTLMIPLGVNTTRFRHVKDARAKLDLDDVPLFVYVGRFSKEKGLLDLIDAINILPPNLKQGMSVVLIGAGPLAASLAYLIKHTDLEKSIRMVPWVAPSELPLWYSAADAVILPSYTEGFSRIIGEAMACGTPIIGTRISGTRDHVIPNVTGYLYDPGDVAELGRIIAHMVNHRDILRGMRRDTETYVENHLGWEHIVSEIVDTVYKPLVQNPNAINITIPPSV